MKFFVIASGLTLATASLFAKEASSDDFKFWEIHNPTWYIGGAGFMNDTPVASSSTYTNIEIGNIGEVYNSLFRTTAAAFGYQVFFGYNVNPVIATEFKFMQTTAPYKFYLNDFFTPDPLSFGAKLVFQLRQWAFGPSVMINIPISQYFTPYWRFGTYVFYWQRQRHYDLSRSQPTPLPMHSNYWAVRVINGVGVKSQLFKYFGIRLEYECPTNPILDTALKLMWGEANLAVYFSF